MKRSSSLYILFGLCCALFCSACGSSDSGNSPTYSNKMDLVYSFTTNTEGWTGDFADYPASQEASYHLSFQYAPLPPPLNPQENALMLSGNNHSDDLFMFIKKKITGLIPNTKYLISFIIEFASNVPRGTTGIGGSPGEGVIIKAGATPLEPVKILNPADGYYRMNIDKGNQSHGGADMIVLGNFSNNTDKHEYVLKTLTSPTDFQCFSNGNGEMWLIVGTDSGFEGVTPIYDNRIEAILQRMD